MPMAKRRASVDRVPCLGRHSRQGRRVSVSGKRERAKKAQRHDEDPWSIDGGRAKAMEVEQIEVASPAVTVAPPSSSNTAVSAPVADTASIIKKQPSSDEDDVALPEPIHRPCRIISPDGRVGLIYTPIEGFEHLFEPVAASQGGPCPEPPAWTGLPTTETQQRHLPGTSKIVTPALTKELPSDAGDTSPGIGPSGSVQISPPASFESFRHKREKRKALRRPRASIYYSDDEDPNGPSLCRARDLETRTFQMGDMKGFKEFLKQRMEELTMKPFRPIVTNWIKLIEPKRLGDYGPYHRALPCEVEADLTPPWWPKDCRYNEPSHLSKADLVNLATDIIMQHRPKDSAKRGSAWTTRLRQAANAAIEMTNAEHFSSSDDYMFGKLMKDRACNRILPSLFQVTQSYEDYVFQYNMWEQDEASHVPQGQTITWCLVERPPRPPGSRKRKARVLSAAQRSINPDPALEGSGDETEVDDTMEQEMLRRLSRRQRSQNKYAQTVQSAEELSRPSTSSVVPSPAQSLLHTDSSMNASPFSSFNQPLTHFNLLEDAKPSIAFESFPVTEVMKQSSPPPAERADLFRSAPATLPFPASPLVDVSSHHAFVGLPPLPPFSGQGYMHPSPAPMYNNGHSFTSDFMDFTMQDPLPAANFFHYDRPNIFAASPFDMAMVPNMPYGGLPCDSNASGSQEQSQYHRAHMPTTNA